VAVSTNADVLLLVEAQITSSIYFFSGWQPDLPNFFLWEGEGMELEVKSGNEFCEGI
jgi:hypothetical protein